MHLKLVISSVNLNRCEVCTSKLHERKLPFMVHLGQAPKCSPLYYITKTHTNTHICNFDVHVMAISSHLTIFSLWQNVDSNQDCSWNSYKKDLTFPISIPNHMIILGKHRTTGNLVIYPAEEALNKRGSNLFFWYTLITSSHRLGIYGLTS
jgi:hypothetical protein